MTTPPTPAGWYPDPDGSGGQRYWDGSAWTEHQAPGIATTPEPSEPPAGKQVGAHRAAEPEDEPEPGPTGPTGGFTEPPGGFTEPPGPPAPPGDNRKLIIWFGAACAALLAVMVLVLVYALFIHKGDTVPRGAA